MRAQLNQKQSLLESIVVTIICAAIVMFPFAHWAIIWYITSAPKK